MVQSHLLVVGAFVLNVEAFGPRFRGSHDRILVGFGAKGAAERTASLCSEATLFHETKETWESILEPTMISDDLNFDQKMEVIDEYFEARPLLVRLRSGTKEQNDVPLGLYMHVAVAGDLGWISVGHGSRRRGASRLCVAVGGALRQGERTARRRPPPRGANTSTRALRPQGGRVGRLGVP